MIPRCSYCRARIGASHSGSCSSDTALDGLAEVLEIDCKPLCAIIGAPCPETNDPASVLAANCGRYCTNWVDGISETHGDGSGRFIQETYKGCFLRRISTYLVSVTAHANHASASADKAASVAQKSGEVASTLLRMVTGAQRMIEQPAQQAQQPQQLAGGKSGG